MPRWYARSLEPRMDSAAPALEIGFVSTATQLWEVARFRYTIYVEEMGRPQVAADHARRLILDSLDLDSHIIVAQVAGQIVGTVRVNLCGQSNIGRYREWYRAEAIAGDCWPEQTAILTRLMVDASHRQTFVNAKLCFTAFQLGAANGIACAMMDCNQHLTTYFSRLGCEDRGTFDHPEYGRVNRLSFDLTDIDRLRRIKSPFLRSLRPQPLDVRRAFSSARPISGALLAAVVGGAFDDLGEELHPLFGRA